MPNYQRWFVEGGTYFFTVVTDERKPLFADQAHRTILGEAFRTQRARTPFDVAAIVLLPDQLHCIWTLPPGDAAYPLRWAQIKEQFTRDYLRAGGQEGAPSMSRLRKRQRSVWQPRFWEHTVCDEDDFKRCLDYIHWNPVKHGYVKRPRDYPWSSFYKYVSLGEYDLNWGDAHAVREFPGAEWDRD